MALCMLRRCYQNMGCGTSKSSAANVISTHSHTPKFQPQARKRPQSLFSDQNNNALPTQRPAVKEIVPKNQVQKVTKEVVQTQAEKAVKREEIVTERKKHKFVDSQKFLDLTYEEAAKLQPKDINEMWAIVKKTSDKDAISVQPTENRKGWRTIRIFVSSTFKDFHQEREVLVKEVSC